MAWIFTGFFLLMISFFYIRQSDAIVAQVEPQKIAVSFEKPVKIKAVHIMPGEDVKQGELLIELERPDLLYDIDKVNNELNSTLQEKKMVVDNINAEIRQLQLEKKSEISDIEDQILQLKKQQSQNQNLISTFQAPFQSGTDSASSEKGIIQLRIDALDNEKQQTIAIYNQRINQLLERKSTETKIYELRIAQLEQELALLNQEKTILKNYSPINGTIGDVMAQAGELKSPFETILSIYEQYPRIIKAYMNEENKYNLRVGDSVRVESSNRNYNITGKVVEIGSRIVSYPNRLLIDQQVNMWGQEIFIEIPENNEFLNGEKVFVRRKSTG